MIFLRLFFGYVLQVLPFAFLSFYSFPRHLRFSPRRSAGLTAALVAGLAALFSGVCLYLQGQLPPTQTLYAMANTVFIATLPFCLLWFLFVIKAPWPKKLFVFSFSLTSAWVITTLYNIAETFFTWPSAFDGLPYQSWSLLIWLVLTAIALPILSLIVKYCYRPVENGMSPKGDVYLSILSLFLFLVLVSAFFYFDYNNLDHTLFSLYISLLVTVFVIYVIFFKIIAISHDRLKTQREADHARHLLSLQTEQYKRIHESIESSRRMRHDLRHHLVTIDSFLQNGEIDQAKEYVESCMEQVQRFESVNFCGNNCANDVVNTMAGYYRSLALERNIEFIARIAIPKETAVKDEDMSVLLGNLLENAIEAASQAADAERYIHFNMIASGKMLAVTLDNGFSGEVRTDGGRYLSVKTQHDGIGLQSIERIAEKYGGGVEFSHEGKVFHSSVMLGRE